ERRALEGTGPRGGGAHRLRDLPEGRQQLRGGGRTADVRMADQQHEAVHQSAQRGGGVRVRGGDRRLLRLLGQLVRRGERGVGGSAEQRGGLVQQRQVHGIAPVQGAEERAVALLGGPGGAERLGLAAEAIHRG